MSTTTGGEIPQTQDTPSGEQPSPQTAEASVEDLDRFLANADAEQLESILQGPAAAEGETPPEPEPQPEPEPEPDADDIQPVEAEETPDPEPASEPPDNPSLDQPNASPHRIRLTNVADEDRATIAEIAKEVGKGKRLEDVLKSKIAAPEPETPEETPAEPAEPARPEAQSPELSDLSARIDERKQAYQQAVSEYDEEAKANILLELQDLKIEAIELKRQADAQKQEQADYSTRFETNVDTLRSQYEDLADENSPMSIRLGELRDLTEIRNPEAQADPDFILKLAQQAAQDVGKAKAPKKSSDPVPQAPQPARQARPVGEVAGASPPVGKSVKSATAVPDFDQMIERMSDEERIQFLNDSLPIPD